jgi:hypothetical protein
MAELWLKRPPTEAALPPSPSGWMQSGLWGRNIKVSDAEREQIKLRAAALDRVSTACTTIGVLAPLWPDSPAIPNGGWMCSTICKPVFRVRLLAESLEVAAGFKTVSAVTPASG